MNVCYVGPARDYSGYGEANRHDIAALDSVEVDVTTRVPRYTPEISEFGELGKRVNLFEEAPLPYKIKILHTTPNVYPKYIEPGKYHIGRVFWETDKLPADFAAGCKHLQEIWTGSQFNADAIKKAGVDVPVYIIPEAVDISVNPDQIEPFIVPNKDDDFTFYSVFEWTERKNPAALLEAFWREFEHTDGVSLTLKTYIDNFGPGKKEEIDQHIAHIKRELGLKHYAPVWLCRKLLNREQMYRFHKTYDCFVSAHRGEGWGIPQMEAMLMGKPIISTACGGIHEHITPSEAYLVPCRMTQLTNNTRNSQWYRNDQQWAEVDQDFLRKFMREAYENKTVAKAKGIAARHAVTSQFSFTAVGSKMRERLEAIETIIAEKPELYY